MPDGIQAHSEKDWSFKVGLSTIGNVWHAPDEWLKVEDDSKACRARTPQNQCVEDALWLWFCQVRASGAAISDLILKTKAQEFGQLLGIIIRHLFMKLCTVATLLCPHNTMYIHVLVYVFAFDVIIFFKFHDPVACNNVYCMLEQNKNNTYGKTRKTCSAILHPHLIQFPHCIRKFT